MSIRSQGSALLAVYRSSHKSSHTDSTRRKGTKPTAVNRSRSADQQVQRGRRRLNQIIESAIKLFSKRGYHLTSVKDIADAGGVSAGLIYQYVKDKQDLLFFSLQRIVELNRRRMPSAIATVENPLEQLISVYRAYCEVIAENREAVLLTYRETNSLDREYRDRLKSMELETNELISGCLRAAINAGYIVPVNVELTTYQLVMMAHTWALKHWRLGELMDHQIYMRESLLIMLPGILTHSGKTVLKKLLPVSEVKEPLAVD